MRGLAGVTFLSALLLAGVTSAHAQIAVSANDAKVKLVNGKMELVPSPPADTIAFIDLRASPPKLMAELNVPSSVAGPPTNVAVSPKEDIVLVTAAAQVHPADAASTIPDDKVTVIDIMALRPGLFRNLICDSSTARASLGQRRNKAFSPQMPSMRASWWPRQK